MLKLYNTLTRKKETFKPINPKEVGVYSCGPTVYWYQHIGNLRTYIFSDLLKRTLLFNGYKVKHVMNVTDVGHLTSDADEGEDKMEKAVVKEGKSANEIANFYLKVFRDDFKKLNIQEPSIWCKATEHIKEQIELIKILEKKGYTYKTSDGIYFNSSKFKKYGKLARINVKGLKAGKRIDLGQKKNKTDFALWKFSEEPGKRQQEWNPKDFGANWPIGFPGWHIECSAMSIKYLGNSFDIHTGGQDHIQIHHTNEIAQSEAATGKKFVNYWMHAAWLLFKGEKVSKSSGGLYTILQLEEKGFNPLDFRYLCLTTNYRKPLEFSIEKLKVAQDSYKRLKNLIAEISDDKSINEKYLKDFEKAINDDLNIPKVLQILWKLVRDSKAKGKLNTIKRIDEVLGLDLLKKEEIYISREAHSLVKQREQARKNKDWKKSDEIRNKIKSLGYLIEDTNEGVKVKKI
ncbi:cysteine--tRNA ligase [Candidatus Pacearchaeota archaeon]|nr:cysteine--tRNA ligase [Candidatus Pacearchaeota archaeon]